MKTFAALLALTLIPAVSSGAPTVALNDEFATREILSGPLPLTWSGYAGDLTLELNDALGVCGANLDDCDLDGSMWLEWTAPETGIYELKSSEPFGVAAFLAPLPPAPQVPAFSSLINKGQAITGVLVELTAAQRLWIMLLHEGDPIPGNMASLRISRANPAPVTKETAAALPSTTTVVIRQATRAEGGWWRWTAPAAGLWRLRLSPYNLFPVTVLRADGVTSAAETYVHPISVAAGEQIFIHSPPHSGRVDWTDVALEPFIVPQNLTPATAQPLVPDADGNGAQFSFESSFYLDAQTANHEAWFSWIAPRDGVAGFASDVSAAWLKAYRDDNGTLTRIDAGPGGYRAPWTTVTAGRRYLISMPVEMSYLIRVEYLPVRGSDSFAGASEVLPGANSDYFGDATSEPGEPGLPSASERTRWWTYTPATDGIVYLAGYKVNLYTGGSLDALTPVTSVDYNAPGHPTLSPVVSVQGGTVYRMQVLVDPRYPGLTSFGVWGMDKTTHDHFADALPAVTSPFLYQQYNKVGLVRATAEPGEPPVTPGVPAEHTAWLRWTADFSGRVMLQSYSGFTIPGFDSGNAQPSLAVWKGAGLATLERVPLIPFQNYYASAAVTSFDATAGTVYSFQVEATPGADSFFLQLLPVFLDAGSSDAFATPLPAEGVIRSSGIYYAVSQRATFEPGESTEGLPVPPPGHVSGSYWIRWTAPASGVWRFASPQNWYESLENNYPVMTLYRGSLAGGRLAVLDRDHPGPVYLKVQAGEFIHIGNIVIQDATNPNIGFFPLLPDISPAVPGIALAEWYGLPVPANLNAAYSFDGIPLLLKHALGLDPWRNSLPGGDDPNASRWPLLTLTAEGEPALSFRIAAPFETGAGVDLRGEISRDLRTWQPAPEANAAGVRTARLPFDGSRGFLRLKASLR